MKVGKIKDENNSVAVYVGSSLSMQIILLTNNELKNE